MSARKQSWNAIAKKLIGKEAVYRGGDGQFAFVTLCREVHYSLWPTREEAGKRKAKVDGTGCGGECRPWTHFILDLSRWWLREKERCAIVAYPGIIARRSSFPPQHRSLSVESWRYPASIIIGHLRPFPRRQS